MDIYTRTGDDGTTGLLFGGRVSKADPAPAAYGDVDEAQAAIGVARAHVERGSELDEVLVGLEADLWVVMAEMATAVENRHKLVAGASRVTSGMVDDLESAIDRYQARYEPPKEFVVPGQEPVSAFLDLARTVTRRAERSAVVAIGQVADSEVLRYLNRLSDLLFVLARWREGGWVAAKEVPGQPRRPEDDPRTPQDQPNT
ncbi:MAG: cob(I)yrinic acid a,c-diamide adenosyltransferase [Microthrixaceae bacterium]|nr:cob(I)yrinic acid a,c-diamide adenosyltransferase [Microthrixaceae bacterium]MCO5318169.1 cob(I)yrinic acid a,c-diamide adenosyltransferase [Microthrixaceae bacterium]